MPCATSIGASAPAIRRSASSSSTAATGGPIRKSSADGRRRTAPMISPSRRNSRLLPSATAGRYSCAITCRRPPAVADSTRARQAGPLSTSHTSVPANPSTGLTTAVPWRWTKSSIRNGQAPTTVAGESSGQRKGDQLLVQRPDAGRVVDHAHPGGGREVEEVRRVQVAGVDGRVDPQHRDVHGGGDVHDGRLRPRRTRARRPATGGRHRGCASWRTTWRARAMQAALDHGEVLRTADPDRRALAPASPSSGRRSRRCRRPACRAGR